MEGGAKISLRDVLVSLSCRLIGLPFRLRKPSAFPASPRAILILKPCCVGDVLLSTPLVATLRRAYPQARLDYAVGPWSRPLLESNSHLDGLIDCGPVGSGRYSWGDYWALVQRLRAGEHEACFVLERSPLMGLLPYLAGIPHRVGLDSGGRGFSLTVRVPVKGIKHEAELYLDTAQAVGIGVERPALEFYPRAEEQERAHLLLDNHHPLVAIHPAGGRNPGMYLPAKRWPPDRFAAIADRIIENLGGSVALLGGPGDEGVAAAVKDRMTNEPLDLTGRLTWGETGAVLENCDLCLGNDTGAIHLAVAVGTPVVAIFGPSDPRMYGPYDDRSVALWKGSEPLPPLRQVKPEDVSIEAVTVEEVWEAVVKMLKARL